MSWQGGRQLSSMQKDGTSLSFAYSDAGLRTEKTVNGATRRYIWNSGRLMADVGASDAFYFHYSSGGELIGYTYKTADTETECILVKNQQGDVERVISADGTVLASYTYDAWGSVLTAEGTLAAANPIRYRGYYYDAETGLYYLQSRYYDPATGRFINADSLLNGKAGTLGFNLFAYCGNNPVNNEDLKGDLFGTICGGIIGGLIGAISGAVSAAIQGKSIVAGAVTGGAAGALIGAACGFIADTFGTGAIALAAGAATCGTIAAVGNLANQYWNYTIEKKAQVTAKSDNDSVRTGSRSSQTTSCNGASEYNSFAEYVDKKSIIKSGITAAAFGFAGVGANGLVNTAFAGALQYGVINRTAQVFANFASGCSLSILQSIIDLL